MVPYVVLREECKPHKAHADDAGLDLRACIEKPVTLKPLERTLIPTGIKVAIPRGYVGFIKDRSGLAAKHGLHVLAGVIDSGYRGEVKVVLVNLSDKPFTIEPHMRIAQLVVLKVDNIFVRVNELPPSGDGREEGGFGSTGVR